MTDTAERLSTAQIEGRLTAALRAIESAWDQMLEPTARTYRGSEHHNGSGRTQLDDDEEEAVSDLPRVDIVVDIRRNVALTLAGWCRIIIEDHNVHHGIPNGHDVPGMCTFLNRWRAQIAEHDAAEDILSEIEDCDHACNHAAYPTKGAAGLVLGECREPLGEGIECGTPVRVVQADMEGRDAGEIRCRGCGTRDVIEGWLLRIVGSEGPFTANQLIPLLHRRLGLRVTNDQLRQWVSRGIIGGAIDEHGQRIYHQGAALYRWADVARDLHQAGITERARTRPKGDRAG